jgi:hypothetical protein
MKLIPVVWDYDSRDYLLFTNPNAFPNNGLENAIAEKAKAQSQQSQGLISLHHDLYEFAAKRSPAMIDQMLSNGMFPMAVSECAGVTQVYSNPSLVIPKSRTLAPVPIPGNSGSNNGNGGNSAYGALASCITLFLGFSWFYFLI